MASEEDPDYVYQPQDAVQSALNTSLIMGTAGLGLSAIQNTLARQNVGAWGMFTKTGGAAATFLAMGASFGFARSAAANLREKDDYWNPTIAGFIAGAIGGVRFRTFPAVIGLGAGLAVLEGVFAYTGGSLSGLTTHTEMDEYERREELRKTRRRPLQETIDQLGERRGIYGPGYQERRAERLKETYGIDVPRT